MIFLHGLGQTSEIWKEVASSIDDCPPLAEMAGEDWLTLYGNFCKYMDKQGCSELCGHSLGAVLALAYTCERPERVSRLILMAPQFDMRPARGLLAVQGAIFRLMPESAFAETGLDKRRFISLNRSMGRLNFTDRLPNISCPTCIVCGERDRANLGAARKLAKLVKESELVIIPKYGHEVNRNFAVLRQILGR